MTWSIATTLLKRVEIHSDTVHLAISGPALFRPHTDIEIEAGRLGQRLSPGERFVVDHNDQAILRLILPIRLKLRGGRSWIVTPSGSPLVAKPQVDRTLIKGLRSARHLIDQISCAPGLVGPEHSRSPASAYERALCKLAFLAPDIQRAVLEGRQPPGFNLQQLIKCTVPLAWADQRKEFGF